MLKSKKVVLFSTVHKILDTRISYRMANTLAENGYKVKLYAVESDKPDIKNVEIIPLKKYRSRFKRFILSLAIFFRLIRDNADIYHFHDPELIPTSIFLSLVGKKVIYDSHEHYPDVLIDRYWIPKPAKKIIASLYNLFEYIGLKLFAGMIVADEMNETKYKNKSINLALIHNYPLEEIILSEEEFENKENNHTLLYLGKIFEIRGIDNLLKMVSIVKNEVPQIKLRLVGESYLSTYKQELLKKIQVLGIEEYVSIEEAVPYCNIKEVTKNSDIGLMIFRPTLNNMQITPNKMFEYMAGGLPIVASDFPAMGSIIRQENCGLLVNPENLQEISDKIKKLLKEKDLRKKLAYNGYKAAVKKYNWKAESKKLTEFYKRII